jgi:hypothetical protein
MLELALFNREEGVRRAYGQAPKSYLSFQHFAQVSKIQEGLYRESLNACVYKSRLLMHKAAA